MTDTDKSQETALYTYAVDGSGVALRCDVLLTHLSAKSKPGLVLVRFSDYVPPFDKYGNNEPSTISDRWRWVDARSLSPVGSYPKLASFNWLD